MTKYFLQKYPFRPMERILLIFKWGGLHNPPRVWVWEQKGIAPFVKPYWTGIAPFWWKLRHFIKSLFIFRNSWLFKSPLFGFFYQWGIPDSFCNVFFYLTMGLLQILWDPSSGQGVTLTDKQMRLTHKCECGNISVDVEENWCKGKKALRIVFSQM